MKLLDRLMARQARLMASLDEPRAKPAVEANQALQQAPQQPLRDPVAEVEAQANAISLLESGNLAGARETLEPFVPSGVGIPTFTTFARICTEQGDFAAALAALRHAEALDPADQSVWRLTARLLAAQKQFSEALVYLRRLSIADPNAPASAHVDLLRGILRAREGEKRPAGVIRANRRELEGVLRRFSAAPEVDDAQRQQFASLYYLLSDGSPNAIALYNTVEPCPPTHRDVTAKIVSLDRWCTQHKLPILKFTDTAADAKDLALYAVKDVQIHSALEWVPILGDGRALAPARTLQSKHFRAMAPDSPLLLFRGSHAELRLPRALPIEETPAVLVGGSASYHDTLVRDLAGLAVVEGAGLARDLPLVVRDDMASFQRELLRLLGYGESRLIGVGAAHPVQFATLYMPSRLALGSRSVAPLVGRWYRSRLVQAGAKPSRRLYVAPGPDVAIENADAVGSMLVSLGFEVVEVAGLDVHAQIELFAQASEVVGATSEGMTNILFCAPGTPVLELRPVHWADSGGHMHFEPLAGACGHRYAAQECVRASGGSGGPISISVGLDQLRQRLEETS